jgi:multimeric flavodoxin WrbA
MGTRCQMVQWERRKKMKVLGILGSPRLGGNSDILLDQALAGAKEAGATVEKVILARKKISGCLDCGKCNKAGVCVIKDDMPAILKKILQADVIIHSVPLYFWAMTAQMKAYLDRWCAFFDENWEWHKPYAPKMNGKKIGLITVCGDPDPSTSDPIVQSFKKTCEFTKMNLYGLLKVSASQKGEMAGNEKAKREAYNLGKKAATG